MIVRTKKQQVGCQWSTKKRQENDWLTMYFGSQTTF